MDVVSMKNFIKKYRTWIWIVLYLVLTAVSFIVGFEPGKDVFTSFASQISR
jgi:hypothetical protein